MDEIKQLSVKINKDEIIFNDEIKQLSVNINKDEIIFNYG